MGHRGGTPKGRKLSQKHREAISLGLQRSEKSVGRPTGVPVSNETRIKIATANTGRRHTQETKAKMRLAHAISRREPSRGFEGHKHSVETRARISQIQVGKKWTEERKAAHSRLLTGISTKISVGQKRVTERLRQQGCLVFQRGWPDLLVVEPNGKVRAIEVKRPYGRLSVEQIEVIKILKSIGLEIDIMYETNEQGEQS